MPRTQRKQLRNRPIDSRPDKSTRTQRKNKSQPGKASKTETIESSNGHKQFGAMRSILDSLDVHVSCVITWAKESFAIGYGDYNNQTEFCLYGWRKIDGAGAHSWYGSERTAGFGRQVPCPRVNHRR